MRISRTAPVAALVSALALLAAAPAQAQMGMPGSPGRGYAPPVKHTAPDPAQDLPPALPGTLNSFAPAERTATDLSPTDALFDAINRGDLAAARDAINHGADLTGHNILGMTPLDLSVDLSHNSITFLLLSMRGSSTPAPHPATAAAAAAAGPPPDTKSLGTKSPAVKAAAAPGKPAQRLAAARSRPAPVPAAPPPAVPRQFAGPADTGTPVPQAGFLGFGGTAR